MILDLHTHSEASEDSRAPLEAYLKWLSATFRGLLRPGQPLVVRGVVTEKHCTEDGDTLECDLVLENEDGDRWVTGTASVRLPAPQ